MKINDLASQLTAKPYSALRLFVLVFASVILAGCANLEAVRDFTDSSARLTAYKDVTERYTKSGERRYAEIPLGLAFDTLRTSVTATVAEMRLQKPDLLKLHNVATGYMASLAALAGEDAYDLSGDLDKVVGSIAAIPALGINTDHATAFSNIAGKVVSWIAAAKQAKDVRTMVMTYGADMDKLLEAMSLAATSYMGVLVQERDSIDSFEEGRRAPWQPQKEDKRTPEEMRRADLVLQLSRRSEALWKKDVDDAVKAADSAKAGISVVRAGHQAMLKNIDRLENKEVVAILKKAASDLKDIRTDLKKL